MVTSMTESERAMLSVSAPLQQSIEMRQYVELLEKRDTHLAKHERFLETFIQLKDYATSLRMAIIGIPDETKRNKKEVALAITKAKKLANKEPVTPPPDNNKRKFDEAALPRVKRAYTKRKVLTTASTGVGKKKQQQSSSSSSTSSTSTSSSSSSTEEFSRAKKRSALIKVSDHFS